MGLVIVISSCFSICKVYINIWCIGGFFLFLNLINYGIDFFKM